MHYTGITDKSALSGPFVNNGVLSDMLAEFLFMGYPNFGVHNFGFLMLRLSDRMPKPNG